MTFLRPLRVVATVAVLAVVGAACTTEEDESSLSGSQSASQSASASESSSGGSSSGGASAGTTETPASSGDVSSGEPTTASPTTTADPSTTSGGTTTGDGTTSGGTTTGNQGGCGDGVINGNEQCDGANLNGFTCEALGNAGGTLQCDPVTCTFDTQMCEVGGSGGTSG